MNWEYVVLILIAFVSGFLGAVVFYEYKLRNEEMLIKEYYAVENAVHVSPHHIRKNMGKDQDYILVDLRSEEEYKEGHIVGAVNIPAYKDRDTADYGAVDRIVSSFRQLKEKNPDKDIIVYCYSMPCMTGRKVGKILAENGIYVKHLNIGWNEWRYFWNLWNHEHEWNSTNVSDYIAQGSEPGQYKGKVVTGNGVCGIENEFSC